jgi:hypothetical protein
MVLVSGDWRLRVAALLPVALGAVLAIAVMPRDNRYVVDAVDPAARELVCAQDDPQVCLSRVHSGLLGDVTPPARQGLAILAKLPGAPTQVHEDNTTYFPNVYPDRHDDVVLLRVEAGQSVAVSDVVSAAFDTTPECDHAASPSQKLAAAFWLIGTAPTATGPHDPATVAEAATLWQTLRQLPAGEAQARVLALRQASLKCANDDQLLSGRTR